VLGQQILSISNFIILTYLFSAWKDKKILLLAPLFFINIAVLALTLKRGEILFPFMVVIGGLFLSNKINKFNLIGIVFLVCIMCYTAMILSPGNNHRPFANKIGICLANNFPGKFPYNDNASSEKKVVPAKSLPKMAGITKNRFIRISCDVLGVQIRETARLTYNFEQKNVAFFKGKTLVANIIGLLPTAYTPFKKEYQFGRVSSRLFGTDPETAGGPRVGMVGEAYINFGHFGIIVLPLLLGVLIWYLDRIYPINHNYSSYSVMTGIIMFFVLSHTALAFLGDGSNALPTFLLRAATLIIYVIVSRRAAYAGF
jgi:hypothetical protein